MDDSIIYARTQIGTKLARDSGHEIPRPMRTLLLAVDGKTRVATYRNLLRHLGDVRVLFEGLENAGYIARVSDPGTRAALTASAPSTNSIQSELRDLAALTGFQPTSLHPATFEPNLSMNAVSQSVSAPTPTTSERNFDVLAKIQEAQSHFTSTTHSQYGRASSGDPRQQLALNRAKSLMTDFLMQHFPDVAMEVGLSIDRISTAQELERSLSDYSILIAPIGRIGAEHLREVRSLIAR